MEHVKNIDEFKQIARAKAELDERIKYIARKYQSFDYVEDWKINSDNPELIEVSTLEIWSDGTHDYDYVSFPISYLFLSEEELAVAVLRDKELKREAARKAKEEETKRYERELIRQEKAELKRLKEKYEKKDNDLKL